MENAAGMLEALDVLDLVLAVFGALMLALWFGRGKSLGGILLGAVVGGFAKPFLVLVFAGLGLFAVTTSQQNEIDPAKKEKVDAFWSQF